MDAETDGPLVDPTELARLIADFADSPDVPRSVVADYAESVERLHKRINIAITVGDADEMALAAHSLKSNSATVGATAMNAVMREIERVGRTGEVGGCGDLLHRSRILFEETLPILREIVDL